MAQCGLERFGQESVAGPTTIAELKTAVDCDDYRASLAAEGKTAKQVDDAVSNLRWACGRLKDFAPGKNAPAAPAIEVALEQIEPSGELSASFCRARACR